MFIGFSLFVIILYSIMIIFSKSVREDVESYIILFGYILFTIMLLYD